MIIKIEKFGKLLVSRPSGKEAAAIMLNSFKPADNTESIDLDFTGVEVMGPSWLDEVLTALREKYGDRVRCLETENYSVIESIKIIQTLG